MDDLDRSIARIAEELRGLQDELKRAGLLAGGDAVRVRRWELARPFGSFLGRLHALFHVHQQAHEPRRALFQGPRPD